MFYIRKGKKDEFYMKYEACLIKYLIHLMDELSNNLTGVFRVYVNRSEKAKL